MKNQTIPKQLLKVICISVFTIIITTGSLYGQNRPSVPVNAVKFTPSPEFSVKVDGRNVLVYSSPVPAAFCSFDFTKPTDITIKALMRDVKWVDVRPLSSGINPVFQNSDSIITLRITKPGQYSIELNGSIKIPLYLFANAPEANKPDRNNKDVL